MTAMEIYKLVRTNLNKYGVGGSDYWEGYIYAMWLNGLIDMETWEQLRTEIIVEKAKLKEKLDESGKSK